MMFLASTLPAAVAIRGAAMASTRSVTYVPWLSSELMFSPPKTLSALEEEIKDQEMQKTKRFVERGALFSAPCLDPQVRQMVAVSSSPTTTNLPSSDAFALRKRHEVGILFSTAQGEGGGNLTRRQGYRSKMIRPVGSV